MTYIWQQKNWPNFTWQSDKLLPDLSKARFAQGELLSRVHSLGFENNKQPVADVLVEESIKTAAIEGVRLDKDAVRSSVARKLGLPTAGLKPPDKDADGLVSVLLNATREYKKPLTATRLKSWQAALFPTGYSGLSKIRVGKWRGKSPMQVVSGPVGREKVHFQAPPAEKIDKEIKDFLRWWNNTPKNLDGLIRSAVAHFYFVTIHPFEDGNGRIARALTEMALSQDEGMPRRYYSLSRAIMAERETYYHVLENCQKGGLDITVWLLWFLRCYLSAIQGSEVIIFKSLQKASFWQKHAQTTLNENQRKVINRLLDAGPDGFIGGLSTRKYVGMTRVSRATAYRDISDLLKKKILLHSKGKGRSVSYVIASDLW